MDDEQALIKLRGLLGREETRLSQCDGRLSAVSLSLSKLGPRLEQSRVNHSAAKKACETARRKYEENNTPANKHALGAAEAALNAAREMLDNLKNADSDTRKALKEAEDDRDDCKLYIETIKHRIAKLETSHEQKSNVVRGEANEITSLGESGKEDATSMTTRRQGGSSNPVPALAQRGSPESAWSKVGFAVLAAVISGIGAAIYGGIAIYRSIGVLEVKVANQDEGLNKLDASIASVKVELKDDIREGGKGLSDRFGDLQNNLDDLFASDADAENANFRATHLRIDAIEGRVEAATEEISKSTEQLARLTETVAGFDKQLTELLAMTRAGGAPAAKPTQGSVKLRSSATLSQEFR